MMCADAGAEPWELADGRRPDRGEVLASSTKTSQAASEDAAERTVDDGTNDLMNLAIFGRV